MDGEDRLRRTDAQLTAATARIGDAAVVHLRGTADLETRELLDNILQTAAEGVIAVIVDLDGLEFLSSTGLSLLMQLHNKLAADDRELRLVAHYRHLLRPFELTGLHDELNFDQSVDEALAVVARHHG
ncbi:STAS domain-containing protein [Kutzneria buriramensis]|nr:STAS domain-containing protein [Kutzneria buriramensis]